MQRWIASDIRDLKADYVLCVKEKQPKLKNEIENFFLQAQDAGSDYVSLQQSLQTDKGHGRIEQRKVMISSDIEWLQQKSDWKDLQIVVRLESIRCIGNRQEEEIRYFITSLPADPTVIAKAIRGHWSIENDCHRVLDVVFREDDRVISEGNAPENLGTIEMLAAKMLKAEKTSKRGLKGKQFKAALSFDYLYRVLHASNF